MSSPRRSLAIRLAVMMLVLLAVGTWIHRVPLLDMLRIGLHRQEQSHILLAPLVAGWLFFLRRSRLRALRVAPTLWGLPVIGIGWLMSRIAIELDVQVAWHTGALVSLLGCIVTITGFRAVRSFAPAIVAMFFLVPVPAAIQQTVGTPLQAMATAVTQTILEFIGVAATREGYVLVVNGEDIAVGEACNGMRMIFALTLIVYAFVCSTWVRPVMAVLLLALSPFIAVLCNIIRLVPTTVIFGYGTEVSARTFHDVSGWIMLPVALFMLIGVLRLLRWLDLPVMRFRLVAR